MDSSHAIALLASLVIGGMALFAALARATGRGPASLAPLAHYGALLALLLGLFSAMLHSRFGHGADSPEPLGLGPFLLEHEAYAVVALLVLAVFVALRFAERD